MTSSGQDSGMPSIPNPGQPEQQDRGTGNPQQRSVAFGLHSYLSQAIQVTGEQGTQFGSSHRRLLNLEERLNEGRFHLAVLGQFKRGKSTLLNALLGEELLPIAVVPLTAIPTFIRQDKARHVRVTYMDEDQPPDEIYDDNPEAITSFLSRFVAEEANPNNRLGISYVEVFHPAPILQKGVVLIDTPGIGSTYRHNTEATLNFLPQCDAALFMVSADPPLTEVEVEFLKEVHSKVPRLCFLLNKIDYLNDEDRVAALEFLRRILSQKAGIDDYPIFCISARKGLEARQKGDDALWTQSGLAEFERDLIDFLVSQKNAALHQALARKAVDIIEDVKMQLELAIRSLELPLSELEDRLRIFEEKINEAEHQRLMAGDILAGDWKRTKRLLEERIGKLRRKASDYLEDTIRDAFKKHGAADEQAAHDALADAIPGFFEREFGEFTAAFNEHITGILSSHQRRADELIETVRRNAAELFDIPYRAPESSEAFESMSQPYWITNQWLISLGPISPGAVDKVLPAGMRRSRVIRRLREQIEDLVIRNAENMRWPILQNIDSAFRQFSATLDRRLEGTIAATHGAMQAAVSRRKEQSGAIAPETERIRLAIAKLNSLQEALGGKQEGNSSVPLQTDQ